MTLRTLHQPRLPWRRVSLGPLLIGLALAALMSHVPGCTSASRTTAPPANRTYAFWPQPPAEPHIQFVRAFAVSTDVSNEQQSGFDKLVFGSEADRAVEINKPYGVAVHDGKVYVCDIRNIGVTILDMTKHQTRLMGVSGMNRLQNPVDVAVADDGMIYVADKLRGVAVYDSTERYVNVFGHDKFQPVGIAVHGDRLYVCNMGTQTVEIMDRAGGSVLGTIGSVGDGDGQFRLPLGIDVDSEGNIHVVDVMRCRLQKFSPDGKLLLATGECTDTAGNFVRPKHVAVDADGLVYVVDAAFQNVQIFDSHYRLLTSFGGAGDHAGSMSLPAGVCVTDAGQDSFGGDIHPYFQARRLIFVTNQFGPSKVSMYALGQLRAGRTPQDLAPAAAAITTDQQQPGQVNPLSGLDDKPPPESGPPGQPDRPAKPQE